MSVSTGINLNFSANDFTSQQNYTALCHFLSGAQNSCRGSESKQYYMALFVRPLPTCPIGLGGGVCGDRRESRQSKVYWASQQVVGRAFVCLLLELASQPSQPALLPTAKAGYGKARYSWIIFRKISPYNLPDRPVQHSHIHRCIPECMCLCTRSWPQVRS